MVSRPIVAGTVTGALLDDVELNGTPLRALLRDVVFTPAGDLDPAALDPANIWRRLLALAANVVAAAPSLPVAPLMVGLSARPNGVGRNVFGVSISLPPGARHPLVQDEITVEVEVDATWVTGPAGADGIVIELLELQDGVPQPFFGISVRGVGLRFGRTGGPLLDTFVVADTLAVHGLVAVGPGGVTDAGGQLELGNLHVALGGAGGGSNRIASGLMRDSASGGTRPEPRFSPALAVQSHGGGPPTIDLRAGEGPGPWWVAIQRGFGPVYIEQVGFGVSRAGDRVIAARVMVDGQVTLLGLSVAVDDLAVGARWPQTAADPALYEPRAWEVDLAGLAVAADTGAIQLAGGLRRAPGAQPDYVGMLSLRFSVYGISVYGGYAVVTDAQGDFTSLFIYGALNAPIGGPPAFFVTGIGAGVGVNRLLLLPADLNQFPSYPLLQALDRNSPIADPEAALDQLKAYFPPARGAFWFAAGISFNSFSLVDGIAVLGVAIGDGLDVNLVGLARAGLPNPSAPLVQLELALLARFSTREGVLWIQAQLTDNSFLLTRDCRLTGGFAYVMWFTGDKAGEFVLTLGGFHPSFRRDGYPVVPRLGFVWSVSDVLVIKGESYFALTSEAIMAGMRFEASLTLGPLWAYLRLGADGIVYFDPFRFQVTAFAELGAGIVIDIDLGLFGHIRITVAVHLHADVLLEGPEFHGSATIDLDVTSAAIAFGDWSDRSTPVLAWPAFEAKYLRPGGAAAITAVPGRGTLPPSAEGSKKAPTGGPDDPFLVLPEFTLTVTTNAAASALDAAGPVAVPPAFLAIGPMQVGSITSTLSLSVRASDGTERVRDLAPTAVTGRFPKGIWGPQPQDEPKPVPAGDMVEAINGATLTAEATIAAGTAEISSGQVEIGKRHPLPFLAERPARAERAADVAAAAMLTAAGPPDAAGAVARAWGWLVAGPCSAAPTPLGAATFAGARKAPPQLVPLTFRMAVDPPPDVDVPAASAAPVPPRPSTRARPLRVDALLSAGTTAPATRSRTTVGEAGLGRPRLTPRRLAEMRATLDARIPAPLVFREAPAENVGDTVIGVGHLPLSGRAGSGTELRRQAGLAPWRARRLNGLTGALRREGMDLLAGELLILTAPNAIRDVEGRRPALQLEGDLPVRIVALDGAGDPRLDVTLRAGAVPLPPRTERVVAIGGCGGLDGAAGWHAGTLLAQASVSTLVGPGCTVRATSLRTHRGGMPVSAGHVVAADAVAGFGLVTTWLPSDVTAVAVVLETAARVDDARGDALDLGLEGADRELQRDGMPEPPRIVVAGGRTTSIYAVRPDGGGASVAVTVASGEHLHLSGVVGARSGAAALAESLQRRDLTRTLATLVSVPEGKATLRWLSQAKAPRRAAFEEVA